MITPLGTSKMDLHPTALPGFAGLRGERLARWAVSALFLTGVLVEAEGLLQQFRRGPMATAREIVFAARALNYGDGHWYANFGYYAEDASRKAWREGGKLYRLNVDTGELVALLEDSKGGIRDPQLDYAGRKVLFSYRRGARRITFCMKSTWTAAVCGN